MDHDEEKVDEFTLAFLYLVVNDRQEGFGARAWKGFDWDTMNRLHEKGLISNPVGKAKSVGMTEKGFKKSENIFRNILRIIMISFKLEYQRFLNKCNNLN